jgi:hypothetical protein
MGTPSSVSKEALRQTGSQLINEALYNTLLTLFAASATALSGLTI